MAKFTLLKVGVVGSIITALCCFTPVLVVLLGVIGLAWVVGYLDYILIPLLLICVGITLYAIWRLCCAKC